MRGILCYLTISSIFLLTGCWDQEELNEIALIEGVGVDRKEDGLIEVTVAIAVPQASSSDSQGGKGSGGANITLIRSGQGRTITEALEQLQTQIPRKIFWGHLQIIILNEKLVKEGITDQIDYFIRHPRPSVHTYVFISKKDNAKDLLGLETQLYSPTNVLSSLTKSKVLLQTTLVDVLNMLKNGSVAIPMVEKLPPQKGKKPTQTIPYLNHTAIFKGDKMIDSIDDHLTRGLLWVRNEIKDGSVTFKPKQEKGYITMTILEAKTKLVPEIKGDKWKITVKGRTKEDIVSYEGNNNLRDKKIIDHLEKELEKNIEERMGQTVQYAQKEKNVDIFQFGDAFERKYPKEWREAKGRWREIYPNVEVQYDIQATIKGIGVGTAH